MFSMRSHTDDGWISSLKLDLLWVVWRNCKSKQWCQESFVDSVSNDVYYGASFTCDNNKKQAQKCTRKHCYTPFRICKCALPRKTGSRASQTLERHDPTWSHLLAVKSTSTSLCAHLSKPENLTPRDPLCATRIKPSWMSVMQQNYSDKKCNVLLHVHTDVNGLSLRIKK